MIYIDNGFQPCVYSPKNIQKHTCCLYSSSSKELDRIAQELGNSKIRIHDQIPYVLINSTIGKRFLEQGAVKMDSKNLSKLKSHYTREGWKR